MPGNPTPSPVLVPQEALPQRTRQAIVAGNTGMRIHELALQAWFHRHFVVTEGYPVPIVFATPMDAYSSFNTMWKNPDNPFSYLLEAKDDDGTPLYEPYPSNARYPLISIKRNGWGYRIEQSYGYHKMRRQYYPTVSDTAKKSDLGNVVAGMWPNAWNYKFQVDHFCMQARTQAIFIQTLMRAMSTGGGSIQTWIPVNYFGWFGTGHKLIRMVLEGDINNISADEPSEGQVEMRTSFNLTLEGYDADINAELHPTLWSMLSHEVSPQDLGTLYPMQLFQQDFRSSNANPVFNTTSNLPSA